MGTRKNDNSKTKQYKVQASKKTKNTRYGKDDTIKVDTKGTKGKKKKKHSKLKKAILIIFIIMVLLLLVGVGVFAGIFFSDRWAISSEELLANGNAEIYDADEQQIALLSAGEGNGNRKVISLDEMGRFTANAYVAIEDKRFYEHSGVDILRTAKATMSYILNSGSSDVGGGSTITQQLVKNLMDDKADSGVAGVERKIREMARAYQLEKVLTKEQVLEKYLNVIFVGGNDLHGVEYGAQYYFAKSAKDLDLAESAFLAGINNAPNMYDPYDKENDHSELIKSRTKLVLQYMKEQNRISDDPAEAEKLYNEAVAKVEKGLEFKQGEIEIGNISYFVATAVKQAAQDLAEKREIDVKEAENIITSGGYKLYTTQVTSIQNTLIKEMARDRYVQEKTVTEEDENGEEKEVTYRTNAGMVIIEPSTGKVVALAGDLQQDQGTNSNYATSTTVQTGSSIKPLVTLAPGLEEKVITASTIYDDTRTKFPGLDYYVQNAGGYQGLCTVRKAIEVSSNIVNMKILSNVGVNTGIDYLHEFGLTTYTKEEDSGLTLALGGQTHGSSPLQMAAAYAALANGGEYIEPIFYTKLVDANGETVLEPEQETRRVISEANAFIVSDILTDVVNGSQGTAYACGISGMDVAAKTGTTEAGGNKWLCGYTPYYAAATWYGFSVNNMWDLYYPNSAMNIWANVMSDIHEELDGKRFEKPDSVVSRKVCRNTGMLATDKCTSTYTEYFAQGNIPDECTGHVTIEICKESGKVANQYCPETEKKTYVGEPEKEAYGNWETQGANKYKVPTEECNIHTEETNKITVTNVVGKTEAEAKTALAGLNIQVIYEHHSDQQDGIVLRQSLSAGTKVDKGVTIVITVNNVETPEPPPEEGNTEDPSGGGNTEDPGSGNTEEPSGGNNTEEPGGGGNTNTEEPTDPTTPTT